MKLNRKWVLVIALVMSVAMATSGTLAYLSSVSDTKANVFTLGGVEIKLDENFVQNSVLAPGVKAPKTGGIENIGDLPAYVWLEVGVPVGLEKVVLPVWAPGVAAEDPIEKTVTYTKDDGQTVSVDCMVYTVKYEKELAGKDATGKVDETGDLLTHITMSNSVTDIEKTTDGYTITYKDEDSSTGTSTAEVTGNLEVYVTAYGIQAEGFANVNEAYSAFNAPVASVDELGGKSLTSKDEDEEVTIIDEDLTINVSDTFTNPPVTGEIKLDVAYQFQPTESKEAGAASAYADWHADFVVSANKPIPKYGIGLVGYYDAWCSVIEHDWIMMATEDVIPANTEIRLVEALGTTVAYKEICDYGNDGIGFLCGAVALNGKAADAEPLAPGTKLTVELRLYEATGASLNTETGNYITIATETYEFN